MRIPTMITAFVVAILVSSTGLAAANSSTQRPPNILFIFTDDHAVQAIGAYGSRINETPNIDRIAKEGAVFTNSFCANSICGPSRANILTGLHSHLNGFLRNGNQFDGNQTTFPPLLQQAGYETAVIGKWHLGTTPVGFDHWEVLPGQGSYYNPDFLQMTGDRERFTGYCTDIITDKSLAWLREQRDPNKPFLLMCQHKAPHRNWSPAERHFSMFPDDVPEPETLFDDYANRTPLLHENEMSIRDHFFWAHDMKFRGKNLFSDHFMSGMGNGELQRMNFTQRQAWDAFYEPENRAFIEAMEAGELSDDDVVRWKYQRYIKDYLKCIAAVDDGVGRLLDYLDDSGLAENTIVIYASDQGFYLGEHGWFDKRWMFEESLKMPFIIRWPGTIPPGSRSDALIQNIDYAPTFLDVVGLDVPSEMQGRSLVPLMKAIDAPPPDWRDAVYYAYYENDSWHNVPVHDGVRNERYKLMYFPRGGQWQLFDLVEDPLELRSVHDDPAYAGVYRGLRKRYSDLRDFYDVNTAIIPQTRGDENWWHDRNVAVNERAKRGFANVLFIGDSITQGWESTGKETWDRFYEARRPINLGFSGDRTEHVIWRLTHGNIGKTTPKVAVLMIGTNNTGHSMQAPGEVADGIREILDILGERLPETEVLLLGVFPRGRESMDAGRLNNIAINQLIRRFDDGERVHYLDIAGAFLESDGTISERIMPDSLHLSPEGYSRWAEAIEPTLRELGL